MYFRCLKCGKSVKQIWQRSNWFIISIFCEQGFSELLTQTFVKNIFNFTFKWCQIRIIIIDFSFTHLKVICLA